MPKAQQGLAATGVVEETGDGAETTVKVEPDSHSEVASIHESSESKEEEKGDEVTDENEVANAMLSKSLAQSTVPESVTA
jgi:hypothetical protein